MPVYEIFKKTSYKAIVLPNKKNDSSPKDQKNNLSCSFENYQLATLIDLFINMSNMMLKYSATLSKEEINKL